MFNKASNPADQAGLQDRDDKKMIGYGCRYYNRNDSPLSTPAERRARLEELDALMALNDDSWIDYWDEWLELFPFCFADAMLESRGE